MASASAAATKRRVRSSRTRARTSNLRAKPPPSGIDASIKHFALKCSIYFVTVPKSGEGRRIARAGFQNGQDPVEREAGPVRRIEDRLLAGAIGGRDRDPGRRLLRFRRRASARLFNYNRCN